MTNRTIRQRILLSFGLILGLMTAMGGAALIYTESIRQDVLESQRTALPGIAHSSLLLLAVMDEQQSVDRHVISLNRDEMRRLESEMASARAAVEAALSRYETTISTAADRELFAAVRSARAEHLREQQRILELSSELQGEAASELSTRVLVPSFDKLQAAMRALLELNQEDARASLGEIEVAVARARTVLSALLLAALGLAFALGRALFRAISQPLAQLLGALDRLRQGDFTGRLMLQRGDEFGAVSEGFDRMADELAALVGQVQRSGLQVNSSVTEVSATAKQQQATAKEIAATTAQIGATSQQISATARELVRTMGEVSGVAERSAALASGGQTGLAHMEETMQQVIEGAGAIGGKLSVLSEKAGNINQVIVTITKVADQTNLLSLNAAIEAEKAGDQGRGFAVVATEIRRLADQTAVASYDIEQTVKEIQSAISASVMGMDKFSEQLRRGMQEIQQIGNQLSEIIAQVQDLAPRFESVSEGMRTQAGGADQIREALAQLSEAAQQTADSLRDSSSAIEDLKQVANGLRGGVSRFKVAAV